MENATSPSTEAESNSFRVTRRATHGEVTETKSLRELMDGWHDGKERWLFIAPHDDDIVMGAGLLLQAALAEGVDVSVLITTDGSMGYCELEDRDSIRSIRQKETRESFRIIGVQDVSWLNFPDCNLTPYLGRRAAKGEGPHVVEGFTGLQNAYTYELRRRMPTRVFLASGNDLHPDHKLVYQEARVSIFHAGGAIWPELGTPLRELPTLYELAIYCAFPEAPDYLIEGTPDHLETKLEAIAAYRSQKQIDRLVERLREAGAVEYLRISDFSLYSPSIYRHLFQSEG